MARQSHLSAALGPHSGRVSQHAQDMAMQGQPGAGGPMMPSDADQEKQQQQSMLLAMLSGINPMDPMGQQAQQPTP